MVGRVLFALLMALLYAIPAHAQPAPPSDTLAEAKRLFSAGTELLLAKDYERALSYT